MKTAAISRFVMAAAIAALVVGGVTPVLAQITFNDFSAPTGLTVNGNAAAPVTNTGGMKVLRLTPNAEFQSGSAWFNTAQPVAGTFSTTFTFQLNSPGGIGPADGFAFVIQNSSATAATALAALGPDGCGIGFGGNPNCQGSGTGITNSLAVEFDTYQNADDPNNNHVSIQSCLTAANTTDSGNCRIADNPNLSGLPVPVLLSDGNTHTVSISFTPPGACSNTACPGLLHVLLDTNDLFPGGVPFDIASIGLTSTGTAFAGFTAATGGGDENQDILNWTFTPQQQSGGLVAGAQTATVLTYSGGPTNGNNGATGYEYDLQLNAQSGDNANPASASANVTAIAMDQKSCNRLVQKSFPLAQCFVYQNADGNHHSGAVLFELTCPNFDGSTTSNCGDTSLNNFAAALGTSFTFVKSQNPFFQLLNLTIGPYPGWLKGDGGASGHPCVPPSTGALFQSNQITSFSVVGDPLGTTKGKSGGGGSCWVATYFTAGEQPSAITITSPTSTTYARNAVVTASYTCSTPATSKDASSPTATVGPYLTAASCTQSQAPNNNTTASCSASTFAGGISCQNGVVDTSSPGQHVFVVTSKDSGGNVNAKIVGYKVSK
jgi:hypothetical protein